MSLLTFTNRTALITGAGRGIGKAIADQLAAQGVKVLCVSKNPDSCGAVAAGIIAAGARPRPTPWTWRTPPPSKPPASKF